MSEWEVGSHTGPASSRPVVTVSLFRFTIEEIHFATAPGTDFRALYEESNSHGIAPGNLHGWGKGAKITDSEWTRATQERYRACFLRRKPVSMRVKIRSGIPYGTDSPIMRLWLRPLLDGSTRHLQPSSASFTFSAGTSETWVDIKTAGGLPNELGRYVLRLRWRLSNDADTIPESLSPTETRHYIYAIYGQPKKPDYDSATDADAGRNTSSSEGTLTGTKKRFDKLMLLTGGSDRRHSVASQAQINNLFWNLHKGINDTPGAPPHFDAGHDQHLTHNGEGSGTKLPLEDQWLAWVPSSPLGSGRAPRDRYWNDASCIGHAQIFKTMLAAVGLFARRTWIFPHTRRLPDGSTWTHSDTDLYCLGTHDTSKEQTWTFSHGGHTFTATCKLMEPDLSWENFEACVRAPNGKFMPGGYNTSSLPSRVRASKGFGSAADLIQWWSNTSRSRWAGRRLPRRFRRFQAWVYHNRTTGEAHFWDVDGSHYAPGDYEQIRDNGKKLPPP